ncbi:MAG: glycosyltransferase [Proteobacteria bacterium]|nr:glycosyltransferase [Pseudomonadota bacterium]
MPKLSVIIPTYQRRDSLQNCLNALERQSLDPARFEVIVVIDGSNDGTTELLVKFRTRISLSHIWQENQGQAAARNHGASKARGDYLVILDDDVVADPALLEEHLKLQIALGGVVGIGNILYEPNDDDWYIGAYAKNWNLHFENLAERQPDWQDLYSGNMSIPRERFNDIGGFSTEHAIAHDAELGCRLQLARAEFAYAPAARVRHRNNKTRAKLIRETEARGAVSYRLSRKFGAVLSDLSASYQQIGPLPLLFFHVAHKTGISGRVLGRLRLALTDGQRTSWQKKVQQYVFWSGLRRAANDDDNYFWRSFTRGVPILAYHAFTRNRNHASRFIVSSDDFETQMQYLLDRGYSVISVAQFLALRRDGKLPTPDTVVVTVDDGYADFAEIAWPVMQEKRFNGTVFVVTERAGSKNTWDTSGELCDRELLSWEQLNQLASAGVEIGAHTRTHPTLVESSKDQLSQEVHGAKEDIEKHLGRSPDTFAFPFGEYNSEVLSMVSETGYEAACTVNPGMNTPDIEDMKLRRIEIFGTDSAWRFRLKVRFGARRPKLLQLIQGL